MLLWMESFDKYGSGSGGKTKMLDGIWAELAASTAGPSATQVRTGLYSFDFGVVNTNQYIRRIWGANKSTVGLGFNLYLSNLPAAGARFYLAKFLNSIGGDICTVTITTTGELEIRTGSQSGTVRATSPVAITAAAWQHIEIKVTHSTTVGACEIRVNGVTVLNASNINTDGAAGGVSSNVSIGRTNADASMYIDDLFAWDTSGSYNNDFIGDKKVVLIYPDADTAVADWVPDTGTVGFSRINEATPSDASYIAAATGGTAGDVSEFTLQDIPINISEISAVQPQPRLLKTDAGTCNVQTALLSGSDQADGADRAITTTATYYWDVFEEDPATNAPWTNSAVNAMLARVTRTA